jgi:hypothetical protein
LPVPFRPVPAPATDKMLTDPPPPAAAPPLAPVPPPAAAAAAALALLSAAAAAAASVASFRSFSFDFRPNMFVCVVVGPGGGGIFVGGDPPSVGVWECGWVAEEG